MKNLKIILAALLVAVLFTACDEEEKYYDNVAPAAPTGVTVISRDNNIEISWNGNRERDLDGYNIYYSDSYNGRYTFIASTYNNHFIDLDAGNGDLYYYAITAYDYNGNESELSYDQAYGVARPEGFNQNVHDYLVHPDIAGYDFSSYSIMNYDNLDTDFFFENYEGTYYVNVWKENQIQDMGLTRDIFDIEFAPEAGWVGLAHPDDNIKYVEAFVGHTYVLRMWDNHYAKLRIRSILPDMMTFDWTYQTLAGEPLLKQTVNVARTDRSGGVRVTRTNVK